jgi:hypothetical protein
LSDIICPSKIIAPDDPPLPLRQSLNTANLNKIIFNIHDPVLLRLLLCKEDKNSDCPYPDHNNSVAVHIACNFPDILAHIYIRHEQIDSIARSCVVVFTEATYLFSSDGLLNIFQNTVNWLNIAHERPYFYVIPRYGKPLASVHTDYAKVILNRELKRIYNGYSKDEVICTIIPADKQAEILRIDYTNESRKFRIEPK